MKGQDMKPGITRCRAILLPTVVLLVACLRGQDAGPAKPPAYPDRADLLVYADEARKLHPVKTAADWRRRKAHVLAGMQLVMGPLPRASRKVPADLKAEEEKDLGKVVRKKVSFAVEKGDRLAAYLLVPKGLKGKAPAALCLHQSIHTGNDEPAGIGGSKNLHYGLELAGRGYVVRVGDEVFENVVPLPLDVRAAVVLSLVSLEGERLAIRGSGVKAVLLGEARYIGEFPGGG